MVKLWIKLGFEHLLLSISTFRTVAVELKGGIWHEHEHGHGHGHGHVSQRYDH